MLRDLYQWTSVYPPLPKSTKKGSQNGQIHIEKLPDWLTDEEKRLLQSAIRDGMYDWLESQYQDSEIQVELDFISVFKSPQNKLLGANNIAELVRKLEGDEITADDLRVLWAESIKRNEQISKVYTRKGWTRAIPEQNQEVEWTFNPLYALQQNDKDPIVITNSLKKFAKTRSIPESLINELSVGEIPDANGWKIIQQTQERRLPREVEVEVRKPEEQRRKGILTIEQMRRLKVPGHYLVHDEGHMVFLPFGRSGVYRSLVNAVRPIAPIDRDPKSSNDMQKLPDDFKLSNEGKTVDGWRRVDYISELPPARVKSPGKHEYSVSRKPEQVVEEFHKTTIQKNPRTHEPRPNHQVPSERSFKKLVTGGNPSNKVKDWELLVDQDTLLNYNRIIIEIADKE